MTLNPTNNTGGQRPVATALLSAFVSLFMVLALALVMAAPASAFEIKRVVSPGGIEAWLIEDEKTPVIAMEFMFRDAGVVDPAGKEGRANLAAATMDEGAGPYDAQAFQGRLQDIASSLSFSAGRSGFSGSLTTLADRADDAFAMMQLALSEPRFDAEAIERIRTSVQQSILRDETNPNSVAQRLFFRTAYPNHPYGLDKRGSKDSLASLTAADLASFVKGELGRDRLIVAVAGNIEPDALAGALDRVFGKLPAKTTVTAIPRTVANGLGQTLLVERPSAQTIMTMGQPGVERSDPDWFAATVLNYVLGGGGFQSRLMDEVRDKRGLTYGVYSSLVPFDQSSLIMAGGNTVNAKVAEALSVIRQEWDRMAKDGVTDEELANAKTYLTGSFPLQFSSTPSIAAILLAVRRDDLGIDYLDRRDSLINAVTRDDVARVANRLLAADKLLTVLVGAPDGVDGATKVPSAP